MRSTSAARRAANAIDAGAGNDRVRALAGARTGPRSPPRLSWPEAGYLTPMYIGLGTLLIIIILLIILL
jgi:hypothetical protein